MNVRINCGTDAESSTVTASGHLVRVVTEAELKKFQIGTDDKLKDAVAKHLGRRPNHAYCTSPAEKKDNPSEDLFRVYGWPETTMNLIVTKTEILGFTSVPTIIASKVFSNNLDEPASMNVELSAEIALTTSSNWSSTDSLTLEQTVNYEVKLVAGKLGGSSMVGYTHEWGKGGEESKTTTVGTKSAMSATLPPHSKLKASLNASQGTMKVRITYMAYLAGNVAVDYEEPLRGHHFWPLRIESLLSKNNIKKSIIVTEDIEIGFFTNDEVSLDY